MTYDKHSNLYTLSSGRRVYANHGIFGLGHDGAGIDGALLTEGYDGPVFDADDWTPDERAEVADEMIRRWTAFKRT